MWCLHQSGLLSPELSENIIGIANVKEVFRSQKLGDIAGCMVEEGVVKKDSPTDKPSTSTGVEGVASFKISP
jgi:translation initiation factor IF-2